MKRGESAAQQLSSEKDRMMADAVAKRLLLLALAQKNDIDLRYHILLPQVDLLVPLPPDLSGSEHATSTAHVTEGSLACTMSTTARDTRNTGDSTTCRVVKSAIILILVYPDHFCWVAISS